MGTTDIASLGEVAWFFLKLGTVAFGGPAAHIALMEDEVVRRRRWLQRQEFLDLLGAANLLPGPSSTELAIFIGYRVAGVIGLLAAGICFILPAALMVTALAWIYVRYGHVPRVAAVLYGVKPVVIAVVLQALCRLVVTAVRTSWLAVIGALCAAMAAAGISPIVLLCAGGILAAITVRKQRAGATLVLPIAMIGTPLTAVPITAPALFAAFLKIGCVVFGSGYVLLAFLQDDLVTHRRWLSSAQLLDAVAIGQVTPGPVFTTATFIGYLLHGGIGALAATVGIFLPAFVLVACSGPLIPRLRQSPGAAAFLDGLNAASLGLMLAVIVQLAEAALFDWTSVIVAVTAGVLLIGFRLNATWVVAGGAVAGLLHG